MRNAKGMRLLALVISTCEEVLAILNGPFLTGAAFIASFALVMQLLNLIPSIGWLWAVLVLLGIDVQYIACARRAHEASGNARLGWTLVTLALAIPMLQTNAIFSLRLQTGMSELAAMSAVYLTPIGWAIERAVLLVVLTWISAVNRPSAQSVPVVPATTPPEPTPPPTTPERPSGKRAPRRDTGRTVEETEALKRRAAPHVLALAGEGQPHREIARRLNLTQFMVSQILKDGKREKGAA